MSVNSVDIKVIADSQPSSTSNGLAEVLAKATHAETPLAVDLDGTLIHTDIFWECLTALAKQNIFCMFRLPFWLIKGKAFIKHEIAKRVTLDVTALPYNDEFVTFLREEQKRGRKLVLTTGCDHLIAQQVADYLGIFSDVLASSSHNNLTGIRKAKALRDKFGKSGFEYAGNEIADLKVWADSCGAIVVNAPEMLVLKVTKITRLSGLFQKKSVRFSAVVRIIRRKR